jgi:hypothetical protein
MAFNIHIDHKLPVIAKQLVAEVIQCYVYSGLLHPFGATNDIIA